MFGGQGTRKYALQKKQARVDDINANANAGSKNLLSSVPKSDRAVKAICYKKISVVLRQFLESFI
jgi:t-SNARE complex subunit (syntaxin)